MQEKAQEAAATEAKEQEPKPQKTEALEKAPEAAAAPEAKQKSQKIVLHEKAAEARQPEREELVFGRWSTREVQVRDIGLAKYLNFETKSIPHTFGKHVSKSFGKTELSIVERLVNKIMRSGQGKKKMSGKYIRGRGSTGKKMQAMNIVKKAFELVEEQTQRNPVQVLVDAIQNSAPREDITRISRGGIAYTLAVDVSPVKRIDEAIKNIALAGFAQSFSSRVSAAEALAREITLASKKDSASFSIKRRDELERIAKSSR